MTVTPTEQIHLIFLSYLPVDPRSEFEAAELHAERVRLVVGLASALRVHRHDVDDLARVADDADSAVDELLLDRVVQDDLRGPGLREGKRNGVDAVVTSRVPDVPESRGRGGSRDLFPHSNIVPACLLSDQRSFM